MIPLHFGRQGRLLFGVYSPAADPRKGRGLLICNPWGMEALRAHRSLAVLADRLSRRGFDVLRFDYYGTGDSMGDGDDLTIEGMVDDARSAVEELAGTAAVSRVDLVGLRLGGYVAAAVVQGSPEIARLVLWDPLFTWQELVSVPTSASVPSPDLASGEVAGFAFPGGLAQSVETLPSDLSEEGLDQALVLISEPEGEEPLDLPPGLRANAQRLAAPRCWVEERDFGAGAVPVEAIRRIEEWLT